MRRSLLAIGLLVAAVLALGTLPPSVTAGCVLNCNARCLGHNTVSISWDLICTGSACRVLGMTLSIGCFPDGHWKVIAKDPKPPYIDHPNIPCPGVNVFYKIEVDWRCDDAEGHSTCVTDGVRCP